MNYTSESEFGISYATENSAGLDLPFYDPEVEEVVAKPGERVSLKTGIAIEFPEGTYGEIDSRSSTSKLLLLPLCRTIDGDYRGNIRTVFVNTGTEDVVIKRGDYLFQIIIKPYESVLPFRVSPGQLTETVRGDKGFGHSGRGAVLTKEEI